MKGPASPTAEFLRKAGKLAILLRRHSYRRALRFGVAASVEHRTVTFEHEVVTVLDAGAHSGQFAIFALDRFPNAALHCFEPLPDARQTLSRVLADVTRVKIHGVALGSERGQAELHVAQDDDASSLLRFRRGHSEVVGPEVARVRVNVARLDQLLARASISRPSLLKIDVQGFELEVLRGAEDLLVEIDEILVECSFGEFYEGQALADDVVSFLREKDFRFRGVFSLRRDRSGRCLQGDFLFVRGDS